jgi:hypothetical protein
LANSAKIYHAGLPPLNRSTCCDTLEKRDQQVCEDVFHTVVDTAQLLVGKTKQPFKNPLRIIDPSSMSLCLKTYDWAAYPTAKGAVKLHLSLDGDPLTPMPERRQGPCHSRHGLAWAMNPQLFMGLTVAMLIINPYTA